ncbi:MAG TPA: ATP-binding cassette domain-containing protein [Candidatus Dormibacteraeota bacterium]
MPALDSVNLEIEPGLTLLYGASGSGKSTLLRVFNGLIPHFYGGRVAGLAHVGDHDVLRTPVRRLATHTGFVFQDPEVQLLQARVDREVAFGPANLGLPRELVRTRTEAALNRAGAWHLRERAVATLSGGERQRVAIAAALAMEPAILVLDEPASQLDPDAAASLADVCESLARTGTAVVLAEPRLTSRLAGLRLHLQQGRLEEPSPPAPVETTPLETRPGATAWALDGVTAGFGRRRVLESVHLEGRSGEAVALIGPNGGGKTTLLRVLAGLMAPSGGRAWRREGRTAYLPQNPTALLHRPTVLAEVELTLRRTGADEPPDLVLNEMGLLHLTDRYPRDLSGGERQRAAIAAVLAGSPAIALLDEPTRGLDDRTRAALVGTLRRLLDQGSAVVIATHDRELVAAVGARLVDVGDGKAIVARAGARTRA